jgi:hypothetical protein
LAYLKSFQCKLKPFDVAEVSDDKEHQFACNGNYLSPSQGAALWNSPYLKNLYDFGQDDDPVVQLIRQLFFLQHDGVTFDITSLPTKFAKYLSHENVGKIVGWLESSRSDEQVQKLLNGFIAEIEAMSVAHERKIDVAGLARDRIKLEKELQEAEMTLRKANYGLETVKGKEKQKLQVLSDKTTEKRKKLLAQLAGKDLSRLLAKDRMYEESRRVFRDSLIRARSSDTLYPPHMATMILSAFAWRRAENIQQVVEYLWNVYQSLDGQTRAKYFIDPSLDKQGFFEGFVQQEFTPEDYEVLKQSSLEETKETAFYNLENFLLMQFGYDLFIKSLPKVVPMRSGVAWGVESFPDCGETSLLNFFVALLYDPRAHSFDVSILERLGADQKLIKFFSQQNVLSRLYGKEIHDEWAAVVADRPGIEYVGGKRCEISSLSGALRNMLVVLSRLIPGIEGESLEAQTESLQKVINRVVSITIELNEDFQEESTKNSLEITIGQDPRQKQITWFFKKGHFLVEFEDDPDEAPEDLVSVLQEKFQQAKAGSYEQYKSVLFLGLFDPLAALNFVKQRQYEFFVFLMNSFDMQNMNEKTFEPILAADIPQAQKIKILRKCFLRVADDDQDQQSFWEFLGVPFSDVFDPREKIFQKLSEAQRYGVFVALLKNPLPDDPNLKTEYKKFYSDVKKMVLSVSDPEDVVEAVTVIMNKAIATDPEQKQLNNDLDAWSLAALDKMDDCFAKAQLITAVLQKKIRDASEARFVKNLRAWAVQMLEKEGECFKSYPWFYDAIMYAPQLEAPDWKVFIEKFYTWVKQNLKNLDDETLKICIDSALLGYFVEIEDPLREMRYEIGAEAILALSREIRLKELQAVMNNQDSLVFKKQAKPFYQIIIRALDDFAVDDKKSLVGIIGNMPPLPQELSSEQEALQAWARKQGVA